MDRTQVRDTLARIAGEAHDAQQAGQRAYDMARRLEKALAVPFEEPPVVEPEEPSGFVPYWTATRRGHYTLRLAPDSRNSGRSTNLTIARPEHDGRMPFIEQFITEAGGVTETICVLHNGNPEERGAITIPRLTVNTHDGRRIFDGEDVVIPPGGMFAVGDYKGKRGEPDPPSVFWDHYAHSVIGSADDYSWADNQLWPWLSKLDALYPKVNGARMAWDPEGARGGGQGIEPYRFEWRKCPAGFALAMQELIGVANRTTRCMTDADGRFTWDPAQPYTDVQEAVVNQWMPDAFKWTPETPAEKARAEWKNIDGQHAIRAWSAAMFLARETRHPFALWFLDMYANWMEAVHLGEAGDADSNPAWWSISRKIDEANGPNEHCGRAAAHALRFADSLLETGHGEPGTHGVWVHYGNLLAASLGEHGNPHAAKAEVFTNANFRVWKERSKNTRCTQGFEMQLLLLAFEDAGHTPLLDAAAKLRAFLTDSPAYAYNLETGEKRGKAHPYLNLATHGVGFESMDELRKVSAERIEASGPEGGGAVPANSLNPRRPLR